MSDKMTPLSFQKLLFWIAAEHEQKKTIFGIPEEKFFKIAEENTFTLFNETCAAPIGPAAGPHTQLAQNIIAAYLTGARFFELKTVQILDTLEIEKPCIDAEDEAYNTEWSSEYTVPAAFDEYLKAWFALYFIQNKFFKKNARDFIFNMSVGYDLKGIKSEKVDAFIENLKNAKNHPLFSGYTAALPKEISKNISPNISSSLTLSTMHGCPPEEIEAICSYILTEKKLNTFVKLNPTLLGYDTVRKILDSLGYDYIELSKESFNHDLQFDDAVAMLKRLQKLATENGKSFGVKLSNTLGVKNNKQVLPGDEMYMSGKALFPLTINLAARLADTLGENLKISFSGGANFFNIAKIFQTGIAPVTLATDLLKPGGYYRFNQLAAQAVSVKIPEKLDIKKMISLAENSLTNPNYKKQKNSNVKTSEKLPLFDCCLAPCVVNCPIHQDIPQYIKLVNEKKYKEAYQLIISKNPLPFITGNICDHPCMLKCTRLDYEQPVLIREIKRVAAENGFFNQHFLPTAIDKKVAVIGAGPCGLSAAFFLAKAGFDVTVFDKSEKPGGTVQNIIPDFRLPQSAIDNDLELIKSAGVKFKLGVSENEISIDNLCRLQFTFFVVAIGASKSIELKLEGDNKNIIGAIDFLEQLKQKNLKFNPGENVVIVGGGNSAMDAARAAVRTKGVKNVAIVYRRTEKQMPADKEELEAAKNDGVIFNQLLQPIAFDKNCRLKCQKMKLGAPDESGRKRPVPIENEFVTLDCDSLICAIGERVDKEILKKFGITEIKSITTNVENIFIGGDALRGPASVVEAIADGRSIAEKIIKKSNSSDLKQLTFSPPDLHYDETELIKTKGKIQTAENNDLPKETERCLACDFICDKCVEVCPNRANIAIKVPGFKNISQVIHIDGMCNECGNCETFCPYDGAPYREKLTLFWSEEDFKASESDGFFVNKLEDGSYETHLRFNRQILSIAQAFAGSSTIDKKCRLTSSTLKIENNEVENTINLITSLIKNHKYLFLM